MKQEIKFKTGHCPDCLGVYSSHIILNEDYPTIAKVEEFFGTGSEFSTMLFVSPEEYENDKVERGLTERIYSFDEYDNARLFVCVCDRLPNKIKTFGEACALLGISDKIPDFGKLPDELKSQLEAHYQLAIITKVLNAGEKVDFNFKPNSRFDIDSFYPTDFNKKNDNTDLGFGIYGYCDELERSPGMLCYFVKDETAQYAGVQFRELYLQYYQYPESYLNRHNK